MKREIKFRAYAHSTKEMIPWEECVFPEWLEEDDIVMMQFTGLLDKNKKELYEGDIVQAYRSGRKDLKFEIRHVGRGFVMWRDGDKSEMDCIWFYEFEVIGNIYENAELLKS